MSLLAKRRFSGSIARRCRRRPVSAFVALAGVVGVVWVVGHLVGTVVAVLLEVFGVPSIAFQHVGIRLAVVGVFPVEVGVGHALAALVVADVGFGRGFGGSLELSTISFAHDAAAVAAFS